eukprot:4149463-Prorocentrum_lima.AAC.1
MFASHGNAPAPIISGHDNGDFHMGGMHDAASAAETPLFRGQGQTLGTPFQQGQGHGTALQQGQGHGAAFQQGQSHGTVFQQGHGHGTFTQQSQQPLTQPIFQPPTWLTSRTPAPQQSVAPSRPVALPGNLSHR